ncbi:MAG: alpha-1,2-fucosyltransferase [Acidimicrobiales bacterium]
MFGGRLRFASGDDPVLYVHVGGGLGNQLFQVSCGTSVAEATGRTMVMLLDAPDPTRPFELEHLVPDVRIEAWRPERRGERYLWRFPYRTRGGVVVRYLCDPGFHEVLDLPWLLERSPHPVILDGNWQSPSYLGDTAATRATVLGWLDAHHPPTPSLPIGPDDVSVHVRRGDIAHDIRFTARYGTLGLWYYLDALTAIVERTGPLGRLFVFSDEPGNGIGSALADRLGCEVVPVLGGTATSDLALMTRFRRHVCANSTFSWWGAWLADGDAAVYPARPFVDRQLYGPFMCPESWIRA